jgi:hypothetical protein
LFFGSGGGIGLFFLPDNLLFVVGRGGGVGLLGNALQTFGYEAGTEYADDYALEQLRFDDALDAGDDLEKGFVGAVGLELTEAALWTVEIYAQTAE